MTHCEEVETYIYTKIANGSGGFMDGTPVRQTDAPMWATIEPTSGNDIEISRRKATLSQFTVKVNYPLNGFTYNDTMFITSRFGNLDITGITQSPKRKRDYTLLTARVEGVSDASGGQIMTLYREATPESTSITIDELVGKDVLLAFRDGICKWVVEEIPTVPNQMEYDSDTGTFTLMDGDIFGSELITVLYRT
jgi:hypothetical protein